MSRLKYLLCFSLIFILTGCYESKTVIELNPDGSGIVTTTANFDNATEDQKRQIKALFKDPNVHTDFSRSKMAEKFPEPYFEIVEFTEDQEALHFKSVIKFKDINRLLAVDPKSSMLKGVDFTVEGDDLIFNITRSSQESGFGQNIKFKSPLDKFGQNIYPKETIKIVDPQLGNTIEFSHEYKGDESEKEMIWKDRLKISGHTIKRNVIKYNFANYPVLSPQKADIISAAWNRNKQYKSNTFGSKLELSLGVPLSVVKDLVYLGYDQIYFLSGEYNDGTPIEIIETWQKGFKRFSDENNLAGLGRFKLSLDFSFPKKPVDGLGPLKMRIRLLRGKNLKRVEVGGILPNHTYESPPFSFTTKELANDELVLEVKGPVNQLKDFLIKTKRVNLFSLKPSSWPSFEDSGSVQFWKFLPLKDASLFVDFYDSQEYVWLDVDVPQSDFKRSEGDFAITNEKGLMVKLFPEYKNIPSIPDSAYKDANSFKLYWESLNDEDIIPALLAVFSDMKRLKSNSQIEYWYQTDLGKTLKARTGFFELNRSKIADILFTLYLEMPDQNSHMGLAMFLSNTDLSEYLRDKALKAVKEKKLRNGISAFFKNGLSDSQRSALSEIFKISDYWVESLEIFQLLTKAPKTDFVFVQTVLEDESRSSFVRNYALEVLLDQKQDFSASMLKTYLMDPTLRQGTMQTISNRLDGYRSKDQISKEKLIELLRPLAPVFEDLTEEKNSFETEKINKILELIR